MDDSTLRDYPESAIRTAKLFRERLMPAAEQTLGWYTVPLCHINMQGEPVETRSGVLLQIAEDMYFLVTAGHDILKLRKKIHMLFIVMPEHGLRPVPLINERNFVTTDIDREDLAVFQLTPATVQAIGSHYRYIRLPQLISRMSAERDGGAYLLMGFPTGLHRPDGDGKTHCGGWQYLTGRYSGKMNRVPDYNPELHLVLAYKNKPEIGDTVHVTPPGLSGCGIWYVGDPHSIVTPDTFRLAAIQNAWSSEREYVKGTWIDIVLTIIWKYVPEARRPLEVNGFRMVPSGGSLELPPGSRP
jgi:hypothetical protein